MLDELVPILSATPSANYDGWFKMFLKFITRPAEARLMSFEIITDIYIEFSCKEGTKQQRGGKPGFHKCIRGLQQITPRGDKCFKLLSNG